MTTSSVCVYEPTFLASLTLADATVNGKDPNAALRNIDADTLGQFEKFIDKAAKESAITNPSIPLKSGSGPAETTASASVQPLAKPEPEPAPSTTAPTAGGPSAESAQKTSAEASTTASSSTVQAPESVSKPVAEGKSTSSGLDPSVDGASEVDEEFMANESGGFVKILPDPEIPESSWVQTVPGESEADAALRKEMLEYSMSEIGDVVAELNLEESGDFYGYEGYSDEEDYDDEDDSEATSEEDEYGRTVNKRVVTASYRKEMEELQQMIKDREAKLESKMEQKKPSVQQLSPQPPRPSPTARSKSSDKEAKPKKGVRFSEELDISPAPAAVDALPSPPSPPPAVPFQIAQLHDIAPDEEDALPYLTELMARTGMFNAGPMDPTFEAPPPVAQPKEKGPSLFKREKSSPSAVSATEQPSAAAPKAPTSTLSKSVLERPPVPAKSVPSSALSENVLERSPVTAAIPPSAPAPPKKLSRFKQAQLAANSSSPSSSPVENKPLLSSSVIERPPTTTAVSSVKPPDDLDPDFHRKEVAERYHKLRNKMIQQQGGFARTEEREEDSIVELEEDGEVKKISRFRAARLKGLGPQ